MNSILKSRYSGWFKAMMIVINPDKDELEAILEEEVLDTPEYKYTKKDGTKCIRLDMFMQDVKTDIIFKHSIFVEDKNEEFKSGVKKYINQSGAFQITNSEENLFNNFTNFTKQEWDKGKLISEEVLGKKEIRVAKIGEYELMNMVIQSQEKLNKEGNYFLDIDKILDGDLSGLNITLNEPILSAYAYVDNTEEYKQKVFKYFMKLLDYQSLSTGTTNKYNSGSIKKWNKEWDFIKEDKIYREGRLDNVTEDNIPKVKELNDDDSEY